jgi:transposase-like protein
MEGSKPRVFSRAFKLAAVDRLLAGESASALARELSIRRKLLYDWKDRYLAAGEAALGGRGRPRRGSAEAAASAVVSARRGKTAPPGERGALAGAQARIAELERKVGQQALELDFFRQALRQVEASRRPRIGPGAPASTPSSRR